LVRVWKIPRSSRVCLELESLRGERIRVEFRAGEEKIILGGRSCARGKGRREGSRNRAVSKDFELGGSSRRKKKGGDISRRGGRGAFHAGIDEDGRGGNAFFTRGRGLLRRGEKGEAETE